MTRTIQKNKDIDRMTIVAVWYKALKETNNESFLPLFFDRHRYLVLCGGGGSGKSIFAGRKVLERVTSEPGHRFLVCRKVAKTLRQSCFQQLISQAREHYPEAGLKINKSDMLLSFANGSVIIFAGLDDVEKLKSIYDITGIWVEEASELDEGDFNQLDIRLRTDFPYYLQIILSFNPISIMHWLKKRFFDRKDPRARTHRSTYKDNRFLIRESIETLEAFKDTDPYYYTVYCLGEWGVTGKTVFDAQKIMERLTFLHKNNPVIAQGRFKYKLAEDEIHIMEWEWEDDPDGPVRIYEQPGKGRPYVIGGDTAGDGSDWFTGQVLDNITGKQAAVLRHQYDEDTYAQQMYCLGMYYNAALIGPEVNFSTYPVKLLSKMGYRRLYVRQMEDNFTGRIKNAFGFRTDKTTRQVVLGNLIQLMREHIGYISDETTLLEMLTFVRNEEQRPEAEAGAHDDTIMALAIAYYIGTQQSVTVEGEEPEGAEWTEDMWDDYNDADGAQREYLIRKWGRPKG